jgi:hypothetical protein
MKTAFQSKRCYFESRRNVKMHNDTFHAVQRKLLGTAIFFIFVFIMACTSQQPVAAQRAPNWVTNLNSAFPSRDWVAVTGTGRNQRTAESAAMNALARAFETDVKSLTEATQQFSQIVNDAAGKKSVSFDQSQGLSQSVNTSSDVQGLIGVQMDSFEASDGTVYVVARMNRKECSASYAGMVRDNTAVIDQLLDMAGPNPDTLDSYAALSFAFSVARVTDNFQGILEVLDPSYANRRPGYGGANAIRTAMQACAARITIGIDFETEQSSDRTLFTRAAGSFFRDLGFRINERGEGNYVLRANVSFESIKQAIVSCRYFFDAVLEDEYGDALFSYTDDDRKAHPNNESEARRLAARAVETAIKEGSFATEFDYWLNSLLD